MHTRHCRPIARRLRLWLSSLTLIALLIALLHILHQPAKHVDQHHHEQHHLHHRPPLNASKLALLIENRPSPLLAPLMLHFIATLPPDWPFLFLGSHASLAAISASRAVRAHASSGKLGLARIPANMSTAGPEMISRFLTSLWVYEALLPASVEWLLLFQTDSVVCANARLSVDDFLGYDWVGAPWNPRGQWGGNGGLSLRRVSTIVDVLRNQVRPRGGEPEDVWLSERLAAHPSANVANGSVSLLFAGEVNPGEPERVLPPPMGAAGANRSSDGGGSHGLVGGIDDWRDGFYEPMGYHTGGSGAFLHSGIWGTPELREHIWKYCPEIKMTLAMDAARYVPGKCGARWT
ncbi:hypothetical protein ESCO_000165 [Escovopsis weberi]|uniref:DUF5672 domain-containing protein n=1 Tax=Escovopsis weberi TaxID=150374 RepID=A0A0M8MYA5_ESCWE|nr:hypothetical protein ESCO_000165 [Escovopsis weberi]